MPPPNAASRKKGKQENGDRILYGSLLPSILLAYEWLEDPHAGSLRLRPLGWRVLLPALFQSQPVAERLGPRAGPLLTQLAALHRRAEQPPQRHPCRPRLIRRPQLQDALARQPGARLAQHPPQGGLHREVRRRLVGQAATAAWKRTRQSSTERSGRPAKSMRTGPTAWTRRQTQGRNSPGDQVKSP